MIYKVTLHFRGHQTFEVEANDEEKAECNAIEMLEEACGSIPVEVNDAVVLKSDSQYTDQQELLDREGLE